MPSRSIPMNVLMHCARISLYSCSYLEISWHGSEIFAHESCSCQYGRSTIAICGRCQEGVTKVCSWSQPPAIT
eukprot:3466306-Karenia_brevis.AAC.1